MATLAPRWYEDILRPHNKRRIKELFKERGHAEFLAAIELAAWEIRLAHATLSPDECFRMAAEFWTYKLMVEAELWPDALRFFEEETGA